MYALVFTATKASGPDAVSCTQFTIPFETLSSAEAAKSAMDIKYAGGGWKVTSLVVGGVAHA